ncbi:hypothetical protein [Paenibacillus sp. 276b]|uniref:hypothetical protein n=1 Tax=Paenibacillus sp. 276b TaxID=1566277 RepID=UPI000897C4FC|nr:hypothetical protein [Paenibacillus sp. 276b]SEB27555.1 TDG/mug DNA glycosylase family protein [Paenibacillus sp. 276b]
MKKITIDNYHRADESFEIFGTVNFQTGEQNKITESDLIGLIDDIELNEFVTSDIKEMIEVSKALFAYGYLYWSFLTLAMEQAFKAFEAAITHVHREIYGSNYSSSGNNRLTLSDMISRLAKRRIIDNNKKDVFDAISGLRNMHAHPSFQSQLGLPSYSVIKDICREINSLFLKLNQSSE